MVVVYSVVIGMGSSHVDITSEEVFQRERTFGAHNYHPLPVALCRAQGELTLLPSLNANVPTSSSLSSSPSSLHFSDLRQYRKNTKNTANADVAVVRLRCWGWGYKIGKNSLRVRGRVKTSTDHPCHCLAFFAVFR